MKTANAVTLTAAIPTVTIFVRHSKDCPHAGDNFSKACRCPKHLRWFANGKQQWKAAKTRAWKIAEERRRELEDRFKAADPSKPLPSTFATKSRPMIDRAIELFLSDKKTQGLDPTAHKKHARELGRFAEFMGKRGKFYPHEIELSDLTEFRAGWVLLYNSSLTRSKVQERLRGFLRYLFNAKMTDHIPQLSPIKVTEPPTLPLTEKQYAKLLDVIESEFRNPDRVERIHALIRLMRHSGLAIQDAVTLERVEIEWDSKSKLHSVVTSRQKTGTHVSVPLPPDVAAEVIAVMEKNDHPQYIFWNRRDGKPKAAVDVWERAFKRVFVAAGMPSGHSHQLRDTFAVELLQQGVPLEEVSKLLGHTSIRTTEKSYAPWMKGRQDRLNSLVVSTWAKQPPPPPSTKRKLSIVA
jgi:integrase/recombinase XerD